MFKNEYISLIMINFFKKISVIVILLNTFFILQLHSEEIKKIEITGNDRISNETIKMFSSIKLNQTLTSDEIDKITKDLYETNFFENIIVSFEDGNLKINVTENPIIGAIEINGIKSKSIKENLLKKIELKSKSSFNDFLLKKDEEAVLSELKDLGYYKANVEISKIQKSKNIIDLAYEIDLGNKAKIKKILFTGNKVFKDSKLKSIIISEEYKPWKFISGKKYLNEKTINFDNRLLKNFYLNKGYYNVEINSSFAKAINDDNFEVIFNINANKKFFFNKLDLELPVEFDKDNYKNIYSLFSSYKNKAYSINKIEKLLESIDEISASEQFESTKSFVTEEFVDNKINLKFTIEETDKVYIKKINILGNNITAESVIRNNFEIDEGDPFNEILMTKTLNNLKSLNYFKAVNSKITNDEVNKGKIIDIFVEEKPTGEIMAGAGFGTSGATTVFGVKENNYLGKGVSLDANIAVDESSLKGRLKFTNPNYKNSDKSIFGSVQAQEIDKLSDFGYKTNKTGFSMGTGFELYDDINFLMGFESLYEVIDTDSSASTRQKSQKGNYFDNFLELSFDLDKRNQKFQTTEGYRNTFNSSIPLVSETGTFTNTFTTSRYIEYFDSNVFKTSFFFKSANSLNNEDIKLSERINIPSSRLRGFEFGKTGPKDGNDFIGGNFASSINLSSTIPQILENSQSTEFNIFLDIANVWGVDYDSSLDKSNDIKSAIGIGFDWYSIIGPMNFSLSTPITKSETDIEQSFRFNLGTTF